MQNFYICEPSAHYSKSVCAIIMQMSPEIHIVYQLCVYLNVCNMSYQMEHVTLSRITYLYVAQAVECVLAVAFGKNMFVRVPLSAYFFM